MYLQQKDIPPSWPGEFYPNGTPRPNPWANLEGTEAGKYQGWPVVHRSNRGDVWKLGPDRFVILRSCAWREESPTLEMAIARIGITSEAP